jgi:Phage tail lysozyme
MASPTRKVPRWAGRSVPVVAVLGALAVAPQVYSFVTSAPAAKSGHLAMADQIAPIRAGSGPLLPRLAAADGTFRPQREKTAASAARSARPARTPGARSSKAATSGASSSHHASGTAPAEHGTLTCSGSAGMLPANYAAIVGYLTAHGYTGIAAAGIAGNIYQESMGNPESVGSGGGGLIGWTPLPAGFVTGNPAADLQTQLAALLTFNQQWSQYIPMLNAATSATQAADIYMNYFERPGIPAAYNREAAAAAVASACGF